jgi:Protein of unknown function (DUF3313)
MKSRSILLNMVFGLGVAVSSITWAASEVKPSGFIENLPALEPDADRPGALVYRKPGVNLGAYDKIAIDPVLIWIHPESEYKGIDPDELKVLADGLRASLIAALEPDYPVVYEPGLRVLGLRIAITNVRLKKKERGLLGYGPVGVVVTTVQEVAGKRISLADAAIEVELLDAKTHERLGVLIDKKPGAEKGAESKQLTWEAIRETLDFYSKRFRSRLDEAHRGK